MSETDTQSDDTYDETETDWLANCAYCYGFGYTKSHALLELVAHMEPGAIDKDELDVWLVEHVGDATVRMGGGWRVDEFVSGEHITFPVDDLLEYRDDALTAIYGIDGLLDNPDYDREDINA